MQTFIIFYDYDYGQRKKKAYVTYAKGKRNIKKKIWYGTRAHLFAHFPLYWAMAVVMAHAKANNVKSV